MPRIRSKGPFVAATAEFDLRAGYDKDATLTVTTVYRGWRADGMRRELRRNTLTEIGTAYLNFYKKSYPGISVVGDPKVTDDIRRNEITVGELYRIAHVFDAKSSGGKHFEVDAEIMMSIWAKSPSLCERRPWISNTLSTRPSASGSACRRSFR